MKEFVERYQEAWASTDPLAMKSVWNEAGILHHPILSEPITGVLVPANNHRTKTVIPGFSWTLIRWASSRDWLFIEWENGADIGAERHTWRGVDRMKIDDGRIVEEIVYFDTFPLRAMIDANITYTPMVDVAELQAIYRRL